jgi:hypothetical protein
VSDAPRDGAPYDPTPGVVTVYADVACPFAGFALHGLRAGWRRSWAGGRGRPRRTPGR